MGSSSTPTTTAAPLLDLLVEASPAIDVLTWQPLVWVCLVYFRHVSTDVGHILFVSECLTEKCFTLPTASCLDHLVLLDQIAIRMVKLLEICAK
jgi:hypothetical protein